MRISNYLLAAVPLALLVVAPANAANIVSNAGFETYQTVDSVNSKFADWSQTNFHLHSTAINFDPVHSGQSAASFGASAPGDTLSQTLSTVAGGSYTFSFWLQNDFPGGDGFQAFFDGAKVFDLAGVRSQTFDYTQFSYTLAATTASTVISFVGYDSPAHINLDDVSVTLNSLPVVTAAPEPATWGMMIFGFGLAGSALRRRQKVSTKVSYAV